jgi:hypothetical protein
VALALKRHRNMFNLGHVRGRRLGRHFDPDLWHASGKKRLKPNKLRHPAPGAPNAQSGAVERVFGRKWSKTPMFVPLCSARTRAERNKNGQNRPYLSQLVPVERTHAGTNIAEFGANQRKMRKKPIFVPHCSTCTRANWNKHRGFRTCCDAGVPEKLNKVARMS